MASTKPLKTRNRLVFKRDQSSVAQQVRYRIIRQDYQVQSSVQLDILDLQSMSKHRLSVLNLVASDDMLTGFDANDLRTIMLMWIDHILLKEKNDIEKSKH